MQLCFGVAKVPWSWCWSCFEGKFLQRLIFLLDCYASNGVLTLYVIIVQDFRKRWDRQSRAFYNLFRQADRVEKLAEIIQRLVELIVDLDFASTSLMNFYQWQVLGHWCIYYLRINCRSKEIWSFVSELWNLRGLSKELQLSRRQ